VTALHTTVAQGLRRAAAASRFSAGPVSACALSRTHILRSPRFNPSAYRLVHLGPFIIQTLEATITPSNTLCIELPPQNNQSHRPPDPRDQKLQLQLVGEDSISSKPVFLKPQAR
jgi:hypothetical protein